MSLSDEELAALFLSPSRLQSLSDEDLMAALRMGCNDALAVLFERHSAQVFRIARAILHDDGEAEETVQKVFLDIFRAVNQFNPDRGTFKTWLLQYAYHRSIDRRQHLQSNRFYSRDELDDLMPAELFNGPGHLLCLPPQEVACLVEQVLATLESRQRRVIELTYFEGLTAEDGRLSILGPPQSLSRPGEVEGCPVGNWQGQGKTDGRRTGAEREEDPR